jgi:hypothetical protein
MIARADPAPGQRAIFDAPGTALPDGRKYAKQNDKGKLIILLIKTRR